MANNMLLQEFRKLGVCFIDKTYFVNNVSQECFNNSDDVENVGLFSAFKIYSQDDLDFRIKELKNKGYSEDLE